MNIITTTSARKRMTEDQYRLGIRIALEEMMQGKDYARVEDILRALADSSRHPAKESSDTIQNGMTA